MYIVSLSVSDRNSHENENEATPSLGAIALLLNPLSDLCKIILVVIVNHIYFGFHKGGSYRDIKSSTVNCDTGNSAALRSL